MHQDLSPTMIEDQLSLIPSYVFLPEQPQNLEPDESNDWYVHEVMTYQAEKTDFAPWRAPDTPSIASDIDSIRSDCDSINNSWHNFSIKTEMDENSTVITTSRSVRKKLSYILFEAALEQINNDGHNHQQLENKVRSNKNRLQGIKDRIGEIQIMLPSLAWEEKDDLDGTRDSSTNSKNKGKQDQNSISTEEEEEEDKNNISDCNSNSKLVLVLDENSNLDGNRGLSRNEDQNNRNSKEEEGNNNSNTKLVLEEIEDHDGNCGPSKISKNRRNKDRNSSNTKKKKKSKTNSGNSYSNSHSYSCIYSSSNNNSHSHSYSNTTNISNSSSYDSSSSNRCYSNRVRIRKVVERARGRRTRLESILKEIGRSTDESDHYSSEVRDRNDIPNRSCVHHDRTLIPSSPLLYSAARRPWWRALPQLPFCQTNSFPSRQRQYRSHHRSHRRVDHRSNHLNDLPSYTKRYTSSNPHRRPMFSTEQRSMPVTTIPYHLGVLMASAFESASPEMQRMIIGERLYHQVQDLEPDLAGWITGMLLESDDCYKLLNLLESPKDILRDRIDDILGVLEAHEAYDV